VSAKIAVHGLILGKRLDSTAIWGYAVGMNAEQKRNCLEWANQMTEEESRQERVACRAYKERGGSMTFSVDLGGIPDGYTGLTGEQLFKLSEMWYSDTPLEQIKNTIREYANAGGNERG
jgi:hypothetical protein